VCNLVLKATFTNTAKTVSKDAFSRADVADLCDTADTAMWPDTGRSLILHNNYTTALFKDRDIALTYAIGTPEVIQQGKFPPICGFEVFKCPGLTKATPYTSESLRGFAVWKSALLFATSPIKPAPAVEKLLAAYDIYTDPQTGISFEHKVIGDMQKDTQLEVVECNYGAIAGEVAALTIINTP